MQDLSKYFQYPISVVVLKDAFHIWPEDQVQDYFCKAVALKHWGYKNKYPAGAVPIDTTEFTGNHVMICENRPEGNIPFMGFRSINLAKCQKHFSKFPLLQIAMTSGSPLHAEAVASHIARCEKENIDLIYNGGWTILPEYRRNPELNQVCKEMMIAFDFLFHHNPYTRSEVFGAGVVQYKTEKFFNSYGYDYMTYNGQELGEVPSHYLGGIGIKFLRVEAFKPLAHELGERYQFIWNNRLEFSPELQEKKKAA